MSEKRIAMNIDPTLIARAHIEAVKVELSDLISSNFLSADATLRDEPPGFLHDELAGHRLRLYRERGHWFLASFDE